MALWHINIRFILFCFTENGFVNQNNSTNSCLLAGQQFQAGSNWHPYLPPNGFDTCTLCHCNVSNPLRLK
jgi:hypothetical protein